MSKLRIRGFAVSIDGYGAGPNRDIDNPLGVGGMALHNSPWTDKAGSRYI